MMSDDYSVKLGNNRILKVPEGRVNPSSDHTTGADSYELNASADGKTTFLSRSREKGAVAKLFSKHDAKLKDSVPLNANEKGGLDISLAGGETLIKVNSLGDDVKDLNVHSSEGISDHVRMILGENVEANVSFSDDGARPHPQMQDGVDKVSIEHHGTGDVTVDHGADGGVSEVYLANGAKQINDLKSDGPVSTQISDRQNSTIKNGEVPAQESPEHEGIGAWQMAGAAADTVGQKITGKK